MCDKSNFMNSKHRTFDIIKECKNILTFVMYLSNH